VEAGGSVPRGGRGTSVFVFQPAEEVISGAAPMIAAGVLDDPHADEVYGLNLTTPTVAGHERPPEAVAPSLGPVNVT
jgi:metal-dependent amidase/aminoacylase/carboxypeptidase family protein